MPAAQGQLGYERVLGVVLLENSGCFAWWKRVLRVVEAGASRGPKRHVVAAAQAQVRFSAHPLKVV
jgi:hypothetical protein